jgi:hypothetical protein
VGSVGGPSQRFSQLAELQALDLPPTNAEIAELLSREASEAFYVLQRAYRRAARSACLWEVEARDLVAQKRPLTELAHIGPFLARTPTGNCDTFLPPTDRVPKSGDAVTRERTIPSHLQRLVSAN